MPDWTEGERRGPDSGYGNIYNALNLIVSS